MIKIDAISSALDLTNSVRIHHIAVEGVPRSGDPYDVLKLFKLDAASICEKIK